MHEKPWRLVAVFGFFGVVFVTLLVLTVVGHARLFSTVGAVMLLCGGFVVAGIALLPPVARRKGAGNGPNAAQWVFLLLGVALWCASPVVALLEPGESGSLLDSRGEASVVWFLGIVTWGTAVLMLVALVRQRRRARRSSS